MWHAETEALRASGRLAVVGVVQEQHRERARLFAQWHGIDWPILWDPFNTLGDEVVPVYRLIDADGRLARIDPTLDSVRELAGTVEAPAPQMGDSPPRELAGVDLTRPHLEAVSELTFGVAPPTEAQLEALRRAASAEDASAADHFRLGVAHRLRFDSGAARADDFERAVAAWNAALAARPSQYIWRRRIQQFGPRLDKPYPFYDWVDEARAAIRARGERPVELAVALTGSERSSRGAFEPARDEREPDPDGTLPRDTDGLFEVTGHAVFDTSGGRPAARLHLAARPHPSRDGHWNNETGPARIWLELDSLPEGWRLERRLLTLPGPTDRATDAARRQVDLELRAPESFSGAARLSGYLVTDACRGEAGVCFRTRRDFTVVLRAPE